MNLDWLQAFLWQQVWLPVQGPLEWTFLGYFVALNASQLVLVLVSVVTILQHARRSRLLGLVEGHQLLHPPISIIVPAYNEEASIAESVRSLLQLEYVSHEIIVVNDGSRDGTLQQLIDTFSLYRFPEVYHQEIPTAPVHAIYHSRHLPNLRVVDKKNGGKADSLNAGINASHNPLFCAVDADSILQPDSLQRIVQPFLVHRHTVAAGGAIRIANGCTVRHGFIDTVGVPRTLLPRFQLVEYLRAFMFGRLGWSPLNAVLIISGAFGLFRKQVVVDAGGYRTDSVGEDMELIVRLHRHLRTNRQPYRIVFIPDSVCWTEAPEDLRTLGNQRVRWHRGLLESLGHNWRLLASLRGGAPGWLAYPYYLLFEALAPLFEVAALAYVAGVLASGTGRWSYVAALITVAIGMGVFVTVLSVLLEDLLFRTYRMRAGLLLLPLLAVLENLGYRQLNSWWRLKGLLLWARGRRGGWGRMQRRTSWARG